MAVRPIDANELYRIEKLLDTDIVRQDKVALNLLEQVLYDIQHVPTLTPPNEPLTLEQLREMDGEPVYIIAGDMGISEWNVIKGKGYITLAYDQPTIGFKAVKEGIEFINGRTFSIDSYGVTWLAYRRPPANAGSDPDPVGKGSWADSGLF